MRSAVLLIAAAALAGCGNGSSGNGQEGSSVTIPLTTIPRNEQAPAETASVPEPAPVNETAAAPVEEVPPPPKPEAPRPKEQRKEEPAPAAPQSKEEAAAVETPAPAAAPAVSGEKVPLPETVIARTIARIGYKCGSVVSSARVDTGGESPVYRVVCSSGDSYRAATLGGRLRFRKWNRD